MLAILPIVPAWIAVLPVTFQLFYESAPVISLIHLALHIGVWLTVPSSMYGGKDSHNEVHIVLDLGLIIITLV